MDWFWVKFGSAIVLLAALIAAIVWVVIDHEQWLDDQQKKQNACLKAGGAWIDNRNTDAYCFFNK
ncbi:hypothetical protein SEA_FAUST_250 [Streptomyces phage Faust]|uniref:Uncharacterized protein n=1 Tax=Streptomyces phage Faust TaxID=2767565 RepID=A0A7G9UZ67_9CAUD|nr:hypothetical protein PP456_gp037 [Streptomyces phage Faust]QNN99322.1 hypothetical protein SEA_FAUST_250 [Streptomyces phage Faust]